MSRKKEGSVYKWSDQKKQLAYIPLSIQEDSVYPFKGVFEGDDKGDGEQVSVDTTVYINRDKGSKGCLEIYPSGTEPDHI